MNLKKRLLFTNFMTVAIPILITLFLAIIYLSLFSRFGGTDHSLNRYRQLSALRLEILTEGQNLGLESGEIWAREDQQKELSAKLAEIQGEGIVLKNGQLIFSSREFSKIDLAKLRQGEKNWGLNKRVSLDDISYLVQSINLNYPDGVKIQIILLAPVNPASLSWQSFFWFLGIIFGLFFLLANFFMTRQLSRAILQPVGNLQLAAKEISKGNLKQEIMEEGDLEIRELCQDLETMRLKLKESIYTQLKYEDNRKMLISSISHDLKTPVTTIKGYAEGILDGVAHNPEMVHKYLKTILQKAEQMDKLIDDLVLYTKLDLKQIPFQLERVNIFEYLKACLWEFGPGPMKGNINWAFINELRDEIYVLLDQEEMKRVIMNILDNALKYMDQNQGEIAVYLRETKTSVILEFKDNGGGIREEDLPHIFERFYRADPARTEIKGSGLGLAIAKEIVIGHHGRIWVVSAEGQGTSIMISLEKLERGGDHGEDINRGG